MPRKITPAPERFWAKVNKNGPLPTEGTATGRCWLWTAGRQGAGYGAFHPAKGTIVLAHRYAYELAVGDIPTGLVVDHRCRRRNCVRPSHLEPVTNEVNLARGAGYALRNGMRTSCVNGHPYTLENTYEAPDGGVRCRTCARERDRLRSPGPRQLNPIDDATVQHLYAEGWGATRIRAELGVSLDRLYRAMDRLGLPRRAAGRVTKAA